jgi:hypothetical protein
MNMEILSRVHFDGNNPENCRMDEIFRLEGLDALEPMGMVGLKQEEIKEKNETRRIHFARIN